MWKSHFNWKSDKLVLNLNQICVNCFYIEEEVAMPWDQNTHLRTKRLIVAGLGGTYNYEI